MSKKLECRVYIHVWLSQELVRQGAPGCWDLWWILQWVLCLRGSFTASHCNSAKTFAGEDWNLFCLLLNWNSVMAAECPLVKQEDPCGDLLVRCPQNVHILPLCEDRCVPYLGQWCSGTRALRGHGEHCSDSQANTSRCSVHVDPEGDPGQNDNKEAGDVHLDQVIAHLPLQVETSFDTGELAWGWWETHRRLLKRHGEPPVFSYCLGTLRCLEPTCQRRKTTAVAHFWNSNNNNNKKALGSMSFVT